MLGIRLPNWIVTLLNAGLDALARPGDLRFSCNCCKEPEVVVKYLDMTILVMLKCELRRAWLFYTYTPSLGETASFGGDRPIGGLGAVPPAGPGAEPLVSRGPGWGEALKLKAFCFIFLRHAYRDQTI